MTTNEKKLLSLFCWICTLIVFSIITLSNVDRIRSADLAEKKYTDALEKISQNEKDLTELKERLEQLKTEAISENELTASQTSSDSASSIRKALGKEGIKPCRYQISGKTPNETVEFSLQCDTLPFLRFLKSEASSSSRLHFTYVAIKPIKDTATLDITFRIRHAK